MKKKRTVLLVEDEAVIALDEADLLGKKGFTPVICCSGEDSLRVFRDNPDICLVLMDIDLGRGMDGRQAAELIIKEREVPVVFLSSHVEAEIVARTEGITSYGYIVKGSGETAFIASIKMALRLFEAHTRLKEQKKALEAANKELIDSGNKLLQKDRELRFTQFAVDHNLDEAFWIDRDARIIYVNEAACKALEYTREELLSMSVFEIDPSYSPENWPDRWRNLKEKRRLIIESSHKTKRGRIYPVELRANYVEFEEREYNCAFAQDITERNYAELAIRESEERLRALTASTPTYIYEVDRQGMICFANRTFSGEKNEAAVGTMLVDWFPKKLQKRIKNLFSEVFRERAARSIECTMTDIQGESRFFLIEISPVIKKGNSIQSAVLTGTDLSDRKKMEMDLAGSVEEKSALLIELQHRVRNSLAMIQSLIHLESREIVEPAKVEYLEKLNLRVQAITKLNSMLSASQDGRKVDLDHFLRELTLSVIQSFSTGSEKIDLQLDLQPVQLKAVQAIPIGLILNELLVNSLKYAFPDNRRGKISVWLHRHGMQLNLTVFDDGVGMKNDFKTGREKGMGFRLVRILTEQLNGTIKCRHKKGTEIRLRFPMG